MMLLMFVGVILLSGRYDVAATCDGLGIHLYMEMGCKAVPGQVSREGCPTAFECKGLRKSSKHCFFKDKIYRVDEQIDSQKTIAGCDLGCYCQRTDTGMKFKCAALECPEWIRRPTNSDCYRKYSLDSCCSDREICPPYENSTKCVYDGREYKEGENILPKNSCWRCVCQENFTGKMQAPFCRRRVCNVQIKHQDKLQRSCAPVYYKNAYRNDSILCCPNNWICPNNKELIKGKAISDRTCQYGERKIKVGQYFVKQVDDIMLVKKVICECKIPPLLTCTAEV